MRNDDYCCARVDVSEHLGYSCALRKGHPGPHSPTDANGGSAIGFARSVDPPSPAISTDDEKGAGLIGQVARPLAETEPRPIWQLTREAFDAGFNAGWDADGTPLTFTERMDEAWADYTNRNGSVSVSAQRSEQTGAKSHDLKTWPDYFDELISGRKTFEVRRDDRGYLRGDWLRLREWEPTTQTYTGREIHREVTYILREYHAIDRGYVVMALAPPRAGTVVRQEQAVTPSASAAQKTHSQPVPDPAIEQAKERIQELFEHALGGDFENYGSRAMYEVDQLILAAQQSSASRLQEVETVIRKHRRHVELSPGVGEDVQTYALACYDELLEELKAQVIDSTDVTALKLRLQEVEAERDRYRTALDEIAAWRDGDTVGSHFDEPGSAQMARDALTPPQEQS